ncbi:CLAVATA3/ESR (CLE)-related protein 46 isoform X2 [Rhodamnia argentea]|uniref:CLAVATA3/ESR (CLE)-related protein 46 isoform X2 n=1 Tax=Rhodamnia argentea TaxID=178133 RepID=A0A8B8PRP9_9MYRT|nr:CLAVATA3/ESR (CLE)-related protein 46 isoform X2 [Rhodamnia argentea]
MCRVAPRMRRQGQGVPVLVLLLVGCLLSAFSLHSPAVQAQAVGSVHPKARPSSLETAHLYPGHMGPGLGKEKKMRKTPSGPNPTGNHRPPTKH